MFKLSINQLNLFIVLLFLSKEAFDGVLRYYLYSIGLTPLVYLPPVFIFIFILISIVTLIDVKINKYIFLEFVILLIWLFIGVVNNGFQQSVFNVYVFFPFFLGQLSSWIFNEQGGGTRFVLVLIIIFSFIGVVLDFYIDLPWKGFRYSIGDVEIEGNRSWTAFGIDRISGFARSSFSLASVLITAFFLLYGKVDKLFYFILWLLCGFGIVASTTKGILLVFIVFSILILIRGYSFFVYKNALLISFYLLLFLGIGLPLSSLFVDYSLGLDDPVLKLLLFSFEERLISAWPSAFDLLGNTGFLFGEGFGSVGTASMIFDPANYSPGDNLFVYLFLIFGIFVFPILLIIIRRFRVTVLCSQFKEEVILSFILILLYGIFSNILESAVLGFLFGAIVGYIFNNNVLESRI